MTELRSLSRAGLSEVGRQFEQRYLAFQARGAHLDMTRGKPSAEQLDLVAAQCDASSSARLSASSCSESLG
ncbi:MAG: hypothetical protein ABI895_14275 [Deltaproteobacteria bacterium]